MKVFGRGGGGGTRNGSTKEEGRGGEREGGVVTRFMRLDGREPAIGSGPPTARNRRKRSMSLFLLRQFILIHDVGTSPCPPIGL